MKYEIRNRFTGAVQFTAEIACPEDAPERVKIGHAVRWGWANDANLSGADLSGADLTGVDLRWVNLSDADLRWASLTETDLSGANLRWASLTETDLSGANLSGADLRWADLSGANLSGADLRWADLSGADLTDAAVRGAAVRGASVRGAVLPDAPTIQHIHQRVYEAASAPEALDMSEWHTCETTHCRAGWVVTLAGEAGWALERKMGTPAAAALIYMASDPTLERVPDFYCGNDEALADMKRLADAERTVS